MLSTTTCVHFSLNGIWLFLHNIECSVIRLFGHYCKYISLVLENISCVVLMLHAIVIHSTTFSSTFGRFAFCAKNTRNTYIFWRFYFCMICYEHFFLFDLFLIRGSSRDHLGIENRCFSIQKIEFL